MNHSIKRLLFDPRTDAVGQSPGGAGRHIDRPEQGILESGGIMVGHPGLEPGTSVLSGLRSNLLS